MGMKRKDYINILLLVLIGLVLISIVFICGSLFGSNMDWINQHTVIPEYFRNYFYQNKKLIPDIIYNIGLGQNAFNVSYYGLLSPIILLSYFLPFISMTTYIMIISTVLYLLSIYLFYRFLRPKFDIKLTTLLTIIFMCAAPISFHFHRQIMFVNYFPFLIMTLINIDNCDNDKHKIFLILNILTIILSSFYFSVGSILVIIIYYFYLNSSKKIKEKLKILIPIIISILLSSVLLVPSLCAILNSRGVVNENISILNLIMPNFNYSKVLYGSYALGLSSISIISIAYSILRKDKASKFLGIVLMILLTFPLFRYILNGGLYIRSKVLIPFIPIIILCLGNLLNDLFQDKLELKKIFIIVMVLAILGLFNFNLAYYLDLLGTIVVLFVYYKFKKQYIIIIPLIILSFITIITANLDENYVTADEYKTLKENKDIINTLVKDNMNFYRIAELDNNLYNVNRNFSNSHYKSSIYSSTINNYYKDFYYNILRINNNNYNNLIMRDTSNIIFNKLIGVKYIISKNILGYGYSQIEDNVYQNNYALSLGYASSNIYSIDKFNEVGYPYNLKYLLNGIIVENSYSNDTEDIIEIYNFDLIEKIINSVPFDKTNNAYLLEFDSEETLEIPLDSVLTDKLLFITIEGLESNSCQYDDLKITINGEENSLSCDEWLYHNQNYAFNYLINERDSSSLKITIGQGIYKITDIKMYIMDQRYLETNFDEMYNVRINDNEITGNINIEKEGYMVLSLPYDENFDIYLDDVKVPYEKVNTAFLGFKINSGNHLIKISYHAKGLLLGKILSIFGLLLFVVYMTILLKRNKNFVKMK